MQSDQYAATSPRRFADALESVLISPKMQKLLRAHLASTGRAMTMTNLAKKGGYSSYRIANIQYGLLARRIADVLELELPPTRLSVLCEFIDPHDQSNDHYLIIMRPNFAKALELARVLE